jgi:hypothetical protein
MKTIYKSILVIAVLFLSDVAINRSYAEPGAEKVLSTKDIQTLLPIIPLEAGFTDDDIHMTFDIQNLAPVTPVEADFNDDGINLTYDTKALAPTTSFEADFSDSL